MNTYPINNREYTLFTDFETELSTINNTAIFDLSYLQLIKLSGSNIEKFLQGQLTCDLSDIHEKLQLKGALCNLQGRILCMVTCILFNDEFYLLCPKDLKETLYKNLKLAAQLSRVTFTEIHNLSVYGLYEDNYLISEKTDLATLGSLAWHYKQIENKNFEIYQESSAMFLPHKVDLEKTSFLSLTKGCYKGQEIIARMHYKSKKTHSLVKTIFNSKESLTIGSSSEDLGILVDYCPTFKKNEVLGLFSKGL